MKSRLPAVLVLLLSGCTVGPDYQRPLMAMPVHYKEARGWQQATPQDDRHKGEWWSVYQDATLNSLLSQVSLSNQNVAEYAAQYRQAQALVAQSRAALFPTLDYDASTTRSGSHTDSTRTTSSSHQAALNASWELDLWGKLRRTREEDRASAQASAAELANITLSAQTELAEDYFQLRIMDEKIGLYQQSIAAYQRYLSVIQNQYRRERNPVPRWLRRSNSWRAPAPRPRIISGSAPKWNMRSPCWWAKRLRISACLPQP